MSPSQPSDILPYTLFFLAEVTLNSKAFCSFADNNEEAANSRITYLALLSCVIF